jgi:ankyrin repeat protein
MSRKFKIILGMCLALIVTNCSSAMQKAAYNNDVATANQLLEKGSKLNPEEKLATSAARHGSYEFLEFLKSKGYDILEYDTENGRTTLHYAVSPVHAVNDKDPKKDYSQKIKITDFLLMNGANAKQEDKYGIDPLMAALGGDILDGFIRVSKYEQEIAKEKEIPFMDGEKYKRVIELEQKIQKENEKTKKDVEWFNEKKLPVSEIVSLLLKSKADPNRITPRETGLFTPLHLALVRGDSKSVKLLIQRKVKLNEKNIRGETPLHMAAKFGNKEAYNMLVAAKADLNVTNNDNHTPYDISPWRIDIWKACAANDTKSIQEYIKAGGSVNSHGFYAGSWGWSPLHVAGFEGNMDAVKILLDNGADVNIIFHPQGEIKKVSFPFSFSGLGEGFSDLMSGEVPISSPMYFAHKNEKPAIAQFLQSKGGLKTISIGKMENKTGLWNKNKMIGFDK